MPKRQTTLRQVYNRLSFTRVNPACFLHGREWTKARVAELPRRERLIHARSRLYFATTEEEVDWWLEQ